MSVFEKQLIALKSATINQDFQVQVQIISQCINCIEQSLNKGQVIQQILSTNPGPALADVISTQLIILMPTIKLVRYFMEDFYFRNYSFLPIFKNVLRVLILLVQSDEIEQLQLEFFDIVENLDILLKKYLLNDFVRIDAENMQTTFVCLLKFIELVLSKNCISTSIKILVGEIFLHLLYFNEKYKSIFKNFELVMKMLNLADEFLDHLVEKYRIDSEVLWLYKIIEILFRIFESFDDSDTLQVKCFESIFYGRMSFVLEQIMMLNSSNHKSELFKLCISILNVVLWTPAFSKQFCSKILKKVVKINADRLILILSKSSKKIQKYTRYSMKIFLSALVAHSAEISSATYKDSILETFLQSRISNSIIDLKASEVATNGKALILLYGCSFLRHQFRNRLTANRVLENLTIIINHRGNNIEDDEVWNILRIFAYCSNYAVLSALEYIGVQTISECLLTKASETLMDIQKIPHLINKYIISFAKEFSPNSNIFNTMVFLYLNQDPTLNSPNIGQIIPSIQVLPFLVSSEHNQVVNAVTILQRKQLREDDLNFIVEQCFSNMKSEEVIIQAALSLIDKNVRSVSADSATKVFIGTIAFLEAKQVIPENPQYSKECYYFMMRSCVNLVRFGGSNVDFKSSLFDIKSE